MTSPESPAVQDTDRLREVAAEAEALRRGGPASDGRGWYRTAADRVECFAIADAVLAAVLPEVADELRRRADRMPLSDSGLMRGVQHAATIVTWLARIEPYRQPGREMGVLRRADDKSASAPPTPPGSPPADERATAVETGRVVDDDVRELAVAPNVWVSFHGLDFAVAWEPVPGDSYRKVVKVIPHWKTPAAAVPGTGDDPSYPTADAYEAACAALERHKQRADAAENALRRLTDAHADGLPEVHRQLLLDRPGALVSYVRAHQRRVLDLIAERDRLALDLQARDIAVRKADGLREQVEAERDGARAEAIEAPGRTEEQWTMRYLLNGEPQLAEDNGHIFDSRDEAERHIDAWRTLFPQLTYTDVEYLRRTVTYGPWQPAPAEPEETDVSPL